MRQILHAVHIHAAPAKIYEGLTTEKGLAGWWTTQLKIVGDVIHFTFSGDFNPQMKQSVLDRLRLVEWRCIAGHPNWQDNTFRFSLNDRKGETLVMFTQDYARELSNEVYGNYNFNWGYYLNSLKQYCEQGAGTPFNFLRDHV